MAFQHKWIWHPLSPVAAAIRFTVRSQSNVRRLLSKYWFRGLSKYASPHCSASSRSRSYSSRRLFRPELCRLSCTKSWLVVTLNLNINSAAAAQLTLLENPICSDSHRWISAYATAFSVHSPRPWTSRVWMSKTRHGRHQRAAALREIRGKNYSCRASCGSARTHGLWSTDCGQLDPSDRHLLPTSDFCANANVLCNAV